MTAIKNNSAVVMVYCSLPGINFGIKGFNKKLTTASNTAVTTIDKIATQTMFLKFITP